MIKDLASTGDTLFGFFYNFYLYLFVIMPLYLAFVILYYSINNIILSSAEDTFIQNIQQIDKLEIKLKKKTKNNKITEIINFYHNTTIFIIINNNSLLIRVLFFTFFVLPLLFIKIF